MKKLIIAAAILFSADAYSQTKIEAKEAAKHINETVIVTGKVFGGKLIASNNMTLIDLGGFNPNQDLTVMIAAADRSKFKNKPEEDYKGREIAVTGKIIDFKGKPEIIITEPDQIKIAINDNPVRIPAKGGFQ